MSHLINKGKKLYCAFLDFRKALDYVDRNFLWSKLLRLGIRGEIFNIILSMYKCVKSIVQVGAERTQPFECLLGVRQGECLSPFLFSMYINDIEDYVKTHGFQGVNTGHGRMFLLLYADDTVIISENRQDLQLGLDIVENYCNKWKIILNIEKTKIIIGGKLSVNDRWFYNVSQIEVTKHFTYLGMVFSSGGSFSENQKKIAGQAQKAIFSLQKMLQKFDDIKCDMY